MTKYDCCVIGAGTFGTALAHLLDQSHDVIATHHDADQLQGLNTATTTDNANASKASTITCLTVRPEQARQAINEIESWTTLLNFTPKLIAKEHVLQVASTPPTDDSLHYVAYDDTYGDAGDIARLKDGFKPFTDTLTHTADHTRDLADMAQIYAHTLTYLDSVHLTDEKAHAFLNLIKDTIEASKSLKDVLDAAATNNGFTAATLEHAEAIRGLQRHEQRSLDEVYHDKRA